MIKNKLKNLLYPIKKRHLGGLLRKRAFDLNYAAELQFVKDGFYKRNAKETYAKIIDSSKQMEKALKKGDDILFKEFEMLRRKDLNDFNSWVKKYNRILRKRHIKRKFESAKDYLQGLRKPISGKLEISKGFQRQFELSKKGLKLKPLKIPERYRFNKFGPSKRDQGWGKLA